jgi:hypothetical protein
VNKNAFYVAEKVEEGVVEVEVEEGAVVGLVGLVAGLNMPAL